MWLAFGDESGHSASPGFYSMGMWVGPESAWERFDKAWRMVLDAFEILHLHMREYAHSLGPFKGWEELQRRQLMTAVLLVLEKANVFPLVAALSIAEYRRLTQVQQLRLRDPFFTCLQETIRGCGLFLLEDPNKEKVRIIYSRQDEFPGLQAADLLAYESFRYCQIVQKNLSPKVRFPFQRILDMQPRGDWMFKYLPYWYLHLQASGGWRPGPQHARAACRVQARDARVPDPDRICVRMSNGG
jgi:hypothetical protein